MYLNKTVSFQNTRWRNIISYLLL